MATTQAYLQTHQDRFLDELKAFLRIPSVSTAPQYAEDVRRAAQFVQQKLLQVGADRAELLETVGYPLVYAEKMVNSQLPTVLFYGHYDVQPADPYDLWDQPPFEPIIKNGKIYARGASDDKGQVYIHIKALETMLAVGNLPCNIKFIIEGEEESGSRGIADFLRQPDNVQLLQADAILVSDTSLHSPSQPAIVTGMRGIVAFEVEVTGPNKDLHSGAYGGAVGNPINILCQMMAALHDQDRRITIPGFYDRVATPDAALRAALAQTPFDLAQYQQDLDIAAVIGEKGFSTIERTSIRPTLDINGIWGGYTGPGGKTVLPAKAYAKLSMRLVPGQIAQEVITQFTNYLHALAPPGIRVNIDVQEGYDAALFSSDALAIKAASQAFEAVWGQKPIQVRGGGSLPILGQLQQALGCDVAMMGFGLDSDAIHSPNEHFVVDHFYKGIKTIIAFYDAFAALHAAT
ncbi:MAG: dipeptidase [Bacteroidota bacterium]